MRSSPWQVHGLLSDVQRRCGAQRRECYGGNHLRKMLPAGALLPNEEQLDYFMAIEYDGPPMPYQVLKVDPLDVNSISICISSIVFVSECVLVVSVAVLIAKLSRFNKGSRSTSPMEVNRRLLSLS
ncbi:Extra-large guanine nucleotide-binding protein 3 [Camellia lanceoleosa]|uniref:Extra-large guanine nucleotide-binding protein 3 n=1 Tax=Camellia lanceoleosa TaxID=1840588 RepID=A0ACC0I2P9_9ERIC|nr:Extra-large guanine nucleotide-binding protein 3 [Camellia lanceoleosa]